MLLGLSGAAAQMRPPAVPLVAHDPYFSIWSMADRLNGDGTKHWTGKPNTLTAYARIDGKSYRIMGRDRQAGNELAQTRLEVLPTRTIYEFAGAGVTVGLTFFTPALPDDLDVLSRPLTYIQWTRCSRATAASTRCRSISTPPATWWSTLQTSRCWPLAISSTDCPCCAWARASSPCWPSAATICASIGATSTLPPIRPKASRHSPAIGAGARRLRCQRAGCPIPTSSATCGAAARCWLTALRSAR